MDRNAMLAAFDFIGRRAQEMGKTIEMNVYGGSCLVLVSNFRVATDDVDAIFLNEDDLANRLADEAAARFGLEPDWINEAVQMFVGPGAGNDRQEYSALGEFPSDGIPGLRVFVPTPRYLLAMKLVASRVGPDADDGPDVHFLLDMCGVESREEMEAVVAEFYPRRALPARVAAALEGLWQAHLVRKGGGDAAKKPG
jgi:hypothetical protein